MGRKGAPKTGGRKKGSKNKNGQTFRELLAAFDDGKGFDPVIEMMNLYTLIHADNPLVAVKILTAFLDRMYPTLKSTDHTGQLSVDQTSSDGSMTPQVVVMLPPKDESAA